MPQPHTLSAALLSLTLLAAASCAPTYQLSLKPAQPTNLFVEGREQAHAFTADSLEVRLHFVCFEASRMVFEAVYRNPTHGRQVVVAPTAFAYRPSQLPTVPQPKASGRPKPTVGTQVSAAVAAASWGQPLNPMPAQPLTAFDPEPEITSLQATAEREAAKANRIDWFGAALAITSVVTDISSIGKKETRTQAQSRNALHDAVTTYQIASTVSRVEHAVAAGNLQARAANLQDYALRKVTLEPGQQVRGLVYFPRCNAADAVQVLAPVPGGVLPLDFVQTHTRQ